MSKLLIKIINKVKQFKNISVIFSEISPMKHLLTTILGIIFICISIYILDIYREKELMEIGDYSVTLLISEVFFLGIASIIFNFNLKNTGVKISLISFLIILLIFSDRVRILSIAFIILLILLTFFFRFKEIFVTSFSLIMYLLIIDLLFITLVHFIERLVNDYPYSVTYIFITFSLIIYLFWGQHWNKRIIKFYFGKDVANDYDKEKFIKILIFVYVLIFIFLNISGLLYKDGYEGKFYNLINNSFLTIITITSIMSKENITNKTFSETSKEIKDFLMQDTNK